MSKKERTEVAEKAAEPGAAADATLGLRVLVLTGGAVLMGLEIVGSRVLAPHFGNSVFVWGSLISVFLTALSGGYYVGGRLADRRPSFAFLNLICLAGGLLILLVPFIAPGLCQSLLENHWGEEAGPLVGATVLFLPASFLLGMLSPFSVRLAAQSVQSVGKAAGTLYALSTVGSILGTLVTTFVLIPHFGVNGILRGLGCVMLGVPFLLLLLRTGRSPGAAPMLMIGLGLVEAFVPAPPTVNLYPGDRMRLDQDTPYHHIMIVENVDYDSRSLRFDRFTESAIKLEAPHRSMAGYTDYFQLAFLAQPAIKRALFIGAGGGIGPRTFHEMDKEMSIDVVDIDPRILAIARDWFFMPVDRHIHPVAKDGRMFLRGEEGKYDCILLDAFTIGGRIPFHLTTREFFELASRHLAPGGVFVMNINSALTGENGEIFLRVAKTVTEVFPHVYVFSKELDRDRADMKEPRAASRNQMLFAMNDGPVLSKDDWLARAGQYPERSYVTRAMVYPMVHDLDMEWQTEVKSWPPLTDDYAPIETLRF